MTKPGWIHMNLLDPYVSPRWCPVFLALLNMTSILSPILRVAQRLETSSSW
eukprot:SAG22_NODE_155_length_17123_cov_37.528489_8_plen_51_part_00